MNRPEVYCDNCGKECSRNPNGHEFTTGYGVLRNEDGSETIHCYECGKAWELEQIANTDEWTMYLTQDKDAKHNRTGWKVTNWPGTISIPAYNVSVGNHNWSGRQVHFNINLDGSMWKGILASRDDELVTIHRTEYPEQNVVGVGIDRIPISV